MLLYIKFKTDFLKKMFVLSFGAITTSQLRFSPNNHGDRLEIKKTRFHASFCYFNFIHSVGNHKFSSGLQFLYFVL